MTIRFDPTAAEVRAIEVLADFEGKHVLEIGCGDGRFTSRYAWKAASVLAIDPNEDAIDRAKQGLSVEEKDVVTFLAADAVTLDLSPNAYDVALFSWSM